jgi:cobalt-zinc-cadmium resistance protein CzcA
MLSAIIRWSLENRLIVLVLTGVLVVTGLWSLRRLPIDAFPDTTPVQVQVNTVAPSLSPKEVEQQITLRVELALSGLPHLKALRSLSKFGFSQVIVIFDDQVDIYLARQVISERLQTIELPEGISPPTMGPISTGLGEVFHYILRSDSLSLTELRTLHDWVLKPILASVPGVAEVNSWGGLVKQYHVLVDPQRLIEHGLSLVDVRHALEANNRNVGGGNIEQSGELFLVHGIGLATGIEYLANVPIVTRDGVPIRIEDVARVEVGHEIRRGAVTEGGQGEAILGLAFMLMGENTRVVSHALERKLEEARQSLPEGVEVEVVYNRITLVEEVLHTARKNLFEGAILVVAVLFILMGNLRAGLITALAIPLSMMFAFNMMLQCGIAGSLLSLGAIDFGVVVDSSIIMVENSVRRVSESRKGRSFVQVIQDACLEVRRPTLFGEAIIMIVYLPILTLEGVEGKMFRPMALTFLFVLLGSFILSLTLMPVLASLFLPKEIKNRENFLIRAAAWFYAPLLRLSLRVPLVVLFFSTILLAATLHYGLRLGSEFIPKLSEGSIVANTVRLAGVSLEESVRYGTRIEKLLLEEFPDEVDRVWTRTGTAEVATDPMGLEVSDLFIRLHPRKDWKKAETQEQLVDRMSEALSGLPGMRVIFTQPIEMRMAEMVAGVRADLAVLLFGDDLETLESLAGEVDAVLRTVPGSADVRVDQLTGQPILQADLKEEVLQRYGISGDDVLDILEAVGGIQTGEIREGQKRFDLVVRLDEKYRNNPAALSSIVVPAPDGQTLPLDRLVDLSFSEGPSTIQREWGRRRVTVQCNVRGRDIASFVEEAREKIAARVTLPPEYYLAFGGQFQHLVEARQRLMVVVPLALGLIFLLLYMSFHSIRDAILIFTKVPFAIVGGVFALYWRGMPFSISAAIGFIALSGIAILNGLVVINYTKQLMLEGEKLKDAVYHSALRRLRPVLATAITDAAGFIPMAISTGVGAEVQKPLATVVIGGVISSTLLTLFVLPALYSMFGKEIGEQDSSETSDVEIPIQ